MSHPYENLPSHSFWRSAIAEGPEARLDGISTPGFTLTVHDRIATAGSCFAQHIGKALRVGGYQVLDAEPAPPFLSEANARRFGYGLYSGRYGNIYTVRQLRQFLTDTLTDPTPPPEVWEQDGAFFDALRPTVEPVGLSSPAEVRIHRSLHLAHCRAMLEQADVFIFTLGLTEAWEDHKTGRIFPTCPGVFAGQFQVDRHAFRNFRYPEIMEDLTEVRRLLELFRPGMRLVLTVSPVPLTAAAAGGHVLVANTYSKATLRAAAQDFASDHENTDYFPSYEIITDPAARGKWFDANLRTVRPEGVDRVMGAFLSAYGDGTTPTPPTDSAMFGDDDDNGGEDEVTCDEILLNAFLR
ncbi:MAG: GSCFA domain-containing protein [Paracoccaceae bacterium]|nr:GSCFA domain-containing protein [Paracoccaceae bacterium]